MPEKTQGRVFSIKKKKLDQDETCRDETRADIAGNPHAVLNTLRELSQAVKSGKSERPGQPIPCARLRGRLQSWISPRNGEYVHAGVL